MTFTYDLATDIGQVRLEIGDTDAAAGVKPDGTNLGDEELQVWLDREGSVGAASAAACEALARMWAKVASWTAGPRSESLSDVSKAWAEQARVLRAQHGGGAVVVSAGIDRTDGYSDHANGDDYS